MTEDTKARKTERQEMGHERNSRSAFLGDFIGEKRIMNRNKVDRHREVIDRVTGKVATTNKNLIAGPAQIIEPSDVRTGQVQATKWRP